MFIENTQKNVKIQPVKWHFVLICEENAAQYPMWYAADPAHAA